MAKFEVLDLITEAETIQRVQIRTADDKVTTVETEKVVKIVPGAYGHERLTVGDIIEIKGRFMEKARANPMFREIRDKEVDAKEPTAKPTYPKTPKFLESGEHNPEWLSQRAQYRKNVG